MFIKVLALIFAFLTSLILTPLICKIATAIGAVDKPNERKIHKGIIPRLGGVSIYCSFLLSMLLFTNINNKMIGILIGGSIILIIGIVDDIKDLSPKLKLLGQLIAASVIIFFGVRVSQISNPFGNVPINLDQLGLSIPLTLIWIIGIVNAFNLIDGLDGLASGVSIISLTVMAIASWVSGEHIITVALCLAASTFGFLRYNFNPARIFLGDSGSMFLGFNLGALAILGMSKGAALVSVFIPILILGIPISDTFIAIIRRYINKQPIFKADARHLHHQLLELGLSQKQAVLIIYSISILFGIIALIFAKVNTTQALIIFAVLASIVGIAAVKIGLFTIRSKDVNELNWVEGEKYQKGI